MSCLKPSHFKTTALESWCSPRCTTMWMLFNSSIATFLRHCEYMAAQKIVQEGMDGEDAIVMQWKILPTMQIASNIWQHSNTKLNKKYRHRAYESNGKHQNNCNPSHGLTQTWVPHCEIWPYEKQLFRVKKSSLQRATWRLAPSHVQ